jgi:hypothetical protein
MSYPLREVSVALVLLSFFAAAYAALRWSQRKPGRCRSWLPLSRLSDPRYIRADGWSFRALRSRLTVACAK